MNERTPKYDSDLDIHNVRYLWVSVLDLALKDLWIFLYDPFKTGGRDDRLLELRTLGEWFCSMDESPGTFRWICLMLDQEPGVVLKKIKTDAVRKHGAWARSLGSNPRLLKYCTRRPHGSP